MRMIFSHILIFTLLFFLPQTCLLLVSVAENKALHSEISPTNKLQAQKQQQQQQYQYQQLKPNCVPSCTCQGKSYANCFIRTDTGNLNCLKEWRNLHVTLLSSKVVESWFGFCSGIHRLQIDENKEMSVLDPIMFQGLSSLKALTVLRGVFLSISDDFMKYLPALTSLKFIDNLLETLQPQVFSTCPLKSILDLSNNRLKSLKSLIFENCHTLQTLLVQNNFISELERDTFTGLKSLTILNLQKNQMRELAHEGFHNLTKLVHLNLANNIIQQITSTNFIGLNELKTLSLENNEIDWIHEEAFSTLYHLKFLNLAGNGLVHLHPNLFQYCKYLEQLDISRNRLNFLNHSLLSPLKALKDLKAENNAFQQFDGDAIKDMKYLKTVLVDENVCFTLIPPQLEGKFKPAALCPIREDHSNPEQSSGSTALHQTSDHSLTKQPINTGMSVSTTKNVSKENPMNDITKLETFKTNQEIGQANDQSGEHLGSLLSQPSASSIHQAFGNSSSSNISIEMFIVCVTLILCLSVILVVVIFLHLRCRRKYRRRLEATVQRGKKECSSEHANENENGDRPMSLHPLISSSSSKV